MLNSLFPPEVWILILGRITIPAHFVFWILIGVTLMIAVYEWLTRKEEIDEIVSKLNTAKSLYIAFSALFICILIIHFIILMIMIQKGGASHPIMTYLTILLWVVPLIYFIPMRSHICNRIDDFDTLQQTLQELLSKENE